MKHIYTFFCLFLISGVVNAQIAKSLICVSEEHQAMYATNSGKWSVESNSNERIKVFVVKRDSYLGQTGMFVTPHGETIPEFYCPEPESGKSILSCGSVTEMPSGWWRENQNTFVIDGESLHFVTHENRWLTQGWKSGLPAVSTLIGKCSPL